MLLLNGDFDTCLKMQSDKFIIFGTSNIAMALVDELQKNGMQDRIVCFVDNDSSLWNVKMTVSGIDYEICSPDRLKEVEWNECCVVIASTYVYDILNQLRSMQMPEMLKVYIYTLMVYSPKKELEHYFEQVECLREKYNNQSQMFAQIKNSHAGERCFIIGNGPSLTMQDLDMLKGEFCFAANQIFFAFDKTEWRPSAYVTVNVDTFVGYERQINALACEYKFIDQKALDYGIEIPGAVYLKHGTWQPSEDFFSQNIEKYYYNGGTVAYTAMQIAVYMGFKEIYLLGIDNNYTFEKKKDGKKIVNNIQNHFYKDETDKDKPQNLYANVDVQHLNESFKAAYEYADNHGIKIFNATRGGKLDVYPRMKLEQILKLKR